MLLEIIQGVGLAALRIIIKNSFFVSCSATESSKFHIDTKVSQPGPVGSSCGFACRVLDFNRGAFFFQTSNNRRLLNVLVNVAQGFTDAGLYNIYSKRLRF